MPKAPGSWVSLLAVRPPGGVWQQHAGAKTWSNKAFISSSSGFAQVLYLPPVTGPVELKLGLHTARTVEFLAKP